MASRWVTGQLPEIFRVTLERDLTTWKHLLETGSIYSDIKESACAKRRTHCDWYRHYAILVRLLNVTHTEYRCHVRTVVGPVAANGRRWEPESTHA